MGFINFPTPTPIFPTLPPLAWSVHKKPIMASRNTTAASGRGNQLACAVFPRWAFILTYSGDSWLRDQTLNIVPESALAGLTELEQLAGLFLACNGSYGEFYYNDPDDNSRLHMWVGVGDGVSSTFQLYYSWGYGPFSPSFYAPVSGINTIDAVYFDNVLVSSGLYILDSTNTKLVFTSPPDDGVVIRADFHFYFRCRFLDDQMKYEQFARNLWENKETRFESVKP